MECGQWTIGARVAVSDLECSGLKAGSGELSKRGTRGDDEGEQVK